MICDVCCLSLYRLATCPDVSLPYVIPCMDKHYKYIDKRKRCIKEGVEVPVIVNELETGVVSRWIKEEEKSLEDITRQKENAHHKHGLRQES